MLDLEKVWNFMKKLWDLKQSEERKLKTEAGYSVYLGDGKTGFTLELTWLRERKV